MCASNVWSCVCVSAVSDEDPKPDEHPKLDEDPKPDEDPKLDEAPTPSLHELGEAIAGTGRLRIRWGWFGSRSRMRVDVCTYDSFDMCWICDVWRVTSHVCSHR